MLVASLNTEKRLGFCGWTFLGKVCGNAKMANKPKRVSLDLNATILNDKSYRLFRNSALVSNGSIQPDVEEESSTHGDKRLIRRSSMICSSGFDKYTYDSDPKMMPSIRDLQLDNVPSTSDASSLSDQASVLSDDISPIIKRNSIVHPGRSEVQQSVFINGRFQNPWASWKPPTFSNILKFGLSKDKSNIPTKQELELVLPVVKPRFKDLANPPESGVRVTWFGHSTVLVQFHGLTVLTDPIFSERASPSQVVGPKRYRDPPCTIHELPRINAVVISHNHYDHLDFNTVILLNARFGTDIRWFVPLGLQTWLKDVGCENVIELDWWEENCVPEHSDVSFVFTPAQHWSKRTITDDYKSLWGSWCIVGPKYRFFFAGDTGYCEVFRQIGHMYGPFDVSAIPIGAYEPRWFMKYQHINPEEAVKIHMDIRSRYTLAIHWGTFALANEYYLDPPVRLREGLEKYDIAPEYFFTLKHGDSKLLKDPSITNSRMKGQPLML